MFNVFLPKLLESDASGEAKSIDASLWDVVIFTLGGCPGALVRNSQRSLETLWDSR